MPKTISFAAALLAITFLPPCSSSVAQDTPNYRAGLKSFIVPAPSDLVEAGPDYRVLLEPLAPINNRLIAAFLEPADLDKIRSGHSALLDLYVLVEVPRRAEFTDVSTDQFKEIADSMATQFGATVDATMKDQQEEINRRLKALNSSAAPIALDKPVQLGTLFSKPDASAFGMILAISSGGQTKRMVMGMTILRIQSRVLFGYTYMEYKDESTVQWIRTTDEHWADAILAANK
jgi:hypothetical protein